MLFGRLLGAYVDALQQLNEQMSAFDYNNPSKTYELRFLSLPLFHCDVSMLQEFDENCSFETIQLKLEYTDVFAKYLLLVLQQAHNVCHATHNELFAASMEQALLSLKEFNIDTKLTSLGYCCAVLQSQTAYSWENNPDVPHFAALTVRAAVIMWALVSRWLQAKLMLQPQLKMLATHTQRLLLTLQDQPLHEPECFLIICQMLHELLQLPANSDWHRELLQTLIVYLQHQLDRHDLPSYTKQLLLQRYLSHPAPLLPLLATVAVTQPSECGNILERLTPRLVQLLRKPLPTELPELLALLRALKQMEQQLLQKNQQQMCSDSDEALNASLLSQLPHHFDLPLPTIDANSNWNLLCLQLLEHSQCTSCPEFAEICTLLLQVSCLRLQLKPHTQQQLLGVLQHIQDPLQRLQSLVKLRLETPSSAHTQLQSFFAQHHLMLLNSGNSQLSQLFCEQLPQLYAAGYVKATQLQLALPKLKMTEDGHPLAAVLRLLLCTQSQSGCAHAFRIKDQIVLHCCKCAPLPATLPGVYLGACKVAPPSKTLISHPALAEAVLFKPSCDFVAHHLDLIQMEASHCLRLLKESSNLQNLNECSFDKFLCHMAARPINFMLDFASHVHDCIVGTLEKPLEQQSVCEQRQLLRVVLCSAHPDIEEIWLFHWFKMTFYFLLHTHSLVAQEAILTACQMCAKHGVQPITLWNWYKRDALALVVKIALQAYINEGVRFTRSLRAVSLGFPFFDYELLLNLIFLPSCSSRGCWASTACRSLSANIIAC